MPASVVMSIVHVNDASNMVSQKRALMVCGRSDRRESSGDPTSAKTSPAVAILLPHPLIMLLSRVRYEIINLHFFFLLISGIDSFLGHPN
jgi:hypothetical protein